MARVWRATIDDAEAVASLLVGFRDHLGIDWPSANAYLGSVERLMERNEAEFLLAARDGDGTPPEGVAQLRFRFGVWMAAEDCELEDLFVAESARGHGLGKALVGATIDRATERGCRRIQLDAMEDNTTGLALYRAHGFASGDEVPGRRGLLMRRRL